MNEICRGSRVFNEVFILIKLTEDTYGLWIGDNFSNPETDGCSVSGTLTQIHDDLIGCHFTFDDLKRIYPNCDFFVYGEKYGDSVCHDELFVVNSDDKIIEQFEARWYDWEGEDEYFIIDSYIYNEGLRTPCNMIGNTMDDVADEWMDGGMAISRLD